VIDAPRSVDQGRSSVSPGRIFLKCITGAATILLPQANAAVAAPPAPPASIQTTVATAPTPGAQNRIPWYQLQHRSLNPFDAYRGVTVPPPNMANSPRLDTLIRGGKLYLSLRDAIDLALENNLDIVIARYNLPIAQADVLRTSAGGQDRGVNTGVVTGTPGGGEGGAGAGTGAGGTSTGAGGAGAGSAGLVQSTLGTGTPVAGFDPVITASGLVDHSEQELSNFQLEGVNVYKVNTIAGSVNYNQNFATGGSLQVNWINSRTTSNGIYDFFSPNLTSKVQAIISQPLLAGFGFGPNLRYLRIAKTNQKISDIAFKAQIIATVTQICDIYWDLVNAYDDEQVQERSVAFATETLNTARKQFDLQAIPEMDVLKAEGDLAQREQDLTVARTNLELQELYMKNAITKSLDDPQLEEMPVVPTDHIASQIEPVAEPVENMIDRALKSRPELQEQSLSLENSNLSRKTARNALLPQLNIYGLYAGTGLAGEKSANYANPSATTTLPVSFGGALESTFDNGAPEYQVGVQLNVPLRNRIAKADQERTELEYRQSQVYFEELRKKIRIEVRNARYALEQGASRVQAARQARDLAQKTLNIMQQEQKLGAGSNQQTLSAENDLAQAESALVDAETAYEKARIELRRATGSILDDYGISIADAKSGSLNDGTSSPESQPGAVGANHLHE
jgi:outer membrane protein TolC